MTEISLIVTLNNKFTHSLTRSSGHVKINVGPRAYKNICWTAMTRSTSQTGRFVLNPFSPKPIRPKLCQFVVSNLDDVDKYDGVRVNSHLS